MIFLWSAIWLRNGQFRVIIERTVPLTWCWSLLFVMFDRSSPEISWRRYDQPLGGVWTGILPNHSQRLNPVGHYSYWKIEKIAGNIASAFQKPIWKLDILKEDYKKPSTSFLFLNLVSSCGNYEKQKCPGNRYHSFSSC